MSRGGASLRIWGVRVAVLVCLATIGATAHPVAAATIVIASPAHEETIHDNTGNVPVSVTIRGAAPAGARIRALLDGRPYGTDQRSASFTLTQVERGEHTLQVQLVNPAGRVVASSATVTFYLWQASRLFPSRKP